MNWLSFLESLVKVFPFMEKVVDLQRDKIDMKETEHEEKTPIREIKVEKKTTIKRWRLDKRLARIMRKRKRRGLQTKHNGEKDILGETNRDVVPEETDQDYQIK